MNWNEYFLAIAQTVALKSKDPNTKVGAVIAFDKRILSTGYNGMVEGAPEIWSRPEKYDWVCHAEANAIAFAARNGVRTQSSRIFVTHAPCLSCTKLILQAGIKGICYIQGNESQKYGPDREKVFQLCEGRATIETWLFSSSHSGSLNSVP